MPATQAQDGIGKPFGAGIPLLWAPQDPLVVQRTRGDLPLLRVIGPHREAPALGSVEEGHFVPETELLRVPELQLQVHGLVHPAEIVLVQEESVVQAAEVTRFPPQVEVGVGQAEDGTGPDVPALVHQHLHQHLVPGHEHRHHLHAVEEARVHEVLTAALQAVVQLHAVRQGVALRHDQLAQDDRRPGDLVAAHHHTRHAIGAVRGDRQLRMAPKGGQQGKEQEDGPRRSHAQPGRFTC